MSDLAGELKAAIEAQMDRQFDAGMAGQRRDFGRQGLSPGNPLGGGTYAVQFTDFATGYSGGLTIVPFTVGISVIGEGDVVTFS